MIVAGIVILVHPVAKSHQAKPAVLLLGLVDVLAHVAAVGPNGFEHFHAGLVGSAVQRAPQGADAGRIEANKLASLEPTIRTVDVLQFCS